MVKNTNKPEITGAIQLDKWISKGQSIHLALVDKDVKQLYFGNKYLNVARTPNTGFFFIDSGDSISLTGKDLSNLPNLSGANVRIQTVNWQ
ncbi:MAG: hypothetical protein ACOCVN_02165 [bacterium]